VSEQGTQNGPYGRTAQIYWKKAWHPFPVKGKSEFIPKGVTGLEAKDPGWGQIQDWLTKRPYSNVAVRASGWVAIDVDGAEGVAALAEATAELGELPETWVSTSWGSATAERRQLFFRVPVGYSARLGEGKFRKRFGEHVDVIHAGHRYSIVAPSVHPDTKAAYAWYQPDGTPGGNVLPERMKLPMLPSGWLAFLKHDGTRGAAAPEVVRSSAAVMAAAGEDWYDEATDGPAEHGWTAAAARAEVDRMLERVRTMEANVNTAAGGAMREVGRFVPGLLSQEEAVTECVQALQANPWHSDSWNVAHGKDWTALTLAATAVARGMEEAREVLPAGAAPAPQDERERYTDAFMSARLVREALAGRYVYTAALGWLMWDGARWDGVGDEMVHEGTRQWTLAGYLAAVDTYRRAAAAGAVDWAIGDDPDIRGWAGLQGKGRIESITTLARGIAAVYRDASDFDTDPALLNTPGGVVDLRTGQVMAHDPARLITKVTAVPYVPGAESEHLKGALGALPDDVPAWLQLMLGEAATGHSGERMVLLTGGGRNGKTTIMGAVYRALGDYAQKVPNTLLLKTKEAGGATPERMTLRGVRLAYMEETPEDGYLNVNVAKDLLDAEEVDGRYLYKNTVTWKPTHSIFLNTQHPPTITATDEGAWRRMARVDFPYRYRKTHEELERPNDRRGDPGIKAGLSTPAGRAAVLAWLVDGAKRYFAAGSVEEAGPDPASVVASVRKWRADSDDILRFADDCLEFDTDGWVSGADLYREFARWQKAQGQGLLSSRGFTARLDGHTALPGTVVRTQRKKTSPGLSRPALLVDGVAQPLPNSIKGYAGLRFRDLDTGFELDE
jgi:putative DNA primase/helicase